MRSAERPFLFVCLRAARGVCGFVCSFVLKACAFACCLFVYLRAAEVFVCLFVFLFLRSFVYDPPSFSVPFFLCFRREFRLGRCRVARLRQDRKHAAHDGRLKFVLQRIDR